MTVKRGIVTLIGLFLLNMTWTHKAQGAALLRTKRDTSLDNATDGPSYVLVKSGTTCARITSLSDCSAAARALGLSDVTARDDNQSGAEYDPPYCYLEDGILKYNSGSDGLYLNTGPCSTSDNCVCRGKGVSVSDTDGTSNVIEGSMNALAGVTKSIERDTAAIDSALFDIERKMVTVTEEIGKENVRNITLLLRAIREYRDVKADLKEARTELKGLAYRTIIACKDITIYMEGLNSSYPIEHQKLYFQEQLFTMKSILADSNTTLREAKVIYQDSIRRLDSIEADVESFKTGLDTMLDKDSDEYKSWASIVEVEEYGKHFCLGCIIADVFGCFGFCSLIHYAIATPKVNHELELRFGELAVTVGGAVGDVKAILGDLNDLSDHLVDEVLIVEIWKSAVDKMADKMKETEKDTFYILDLKPKTFQLATDSLQDAAELFLNRPDIFPKELDDLWGDEL